MAKVVEYYFDEATSGTAPTQALDSGPATVCPLTITYGGASNYTEVSGQSGWQSTATTGTQRAVYAISDTSDKVRNTLNAQKTFTLIVVVSMTAISASGGRIFGINDRAGNNGKLMFRGDGLSNLGVMFNDVEALNAVTITSGTRTVFHIVVDTAQASGPNRIIVYKDGALFSSTSVTPPALNDTLSMGSGVDLIAFNRESSGSFDRSVTGTLFYAAIYDNAMTSGEVSTSYTALAANDDTPAGSSPVLSAATPSAQRNRRHTGRRF